MHALRKYILSSLAEFIIRRAFQGKSNSLPVELTKRSGCHNTTNSSNILLSSYRRTRGELPVATISRKTTKRFSSQITIFKTSCTCKRPPSVKRPRRLSQLYFVCRCISWNALILISLHKESSVHPSSKLLLCSLATSDLCVGLIAEPLFFIYFMPQVSKQWNTCRYAVIARLITSYILRGVSAGTLTSCYIYLIV